MVRKQRSEADQEGGRKPASKRDDRVSILPIPESTPPIREVPPEVDAAVRKVDESAAPRAEIETAVAEVANEAKPDQETRGRLASQVGRPGAHPAYERIIQSLLAHRRAKGENVYLLASAVAGEGASTVARNLANAIGNEKSERVVLVDANLRTPSQHEAFNLPRRDGLVDVLAGTVSLNESVSTDPESGLAVLTSGSPTESPPHLLSHSAFHSLMAALRAEFDWVILDGPPVTSYPDAASLGNAAGGAVLVLWAEHTRWEVADEARRVLENTGTDILGAVLNRRKYHIPSFIYRRL
jgi:capsular exopolysaccharide synthesis family protein